MVGVDAGDAFAGFGSGLVGVDEGIGDLVLVGFVVRSVMVVHVGVGYVPIAINAIGIVVLFAVLIGFAVPLVVDAAIFVPVDVDMDDFVAHFADVEIVLFLAVLILIM